MAQSYTCDICGEVQSDNLNDFTIIGVQKYPADPITLYLCEERCWKLFRLFWKQQDKSIVEDYTKKDQDSK